MVERYGEGWFEDRKPNGGDALPKPAFKLGQSVVVHGDVPAKIDRVIYCRNMVRPIYSVEWWQDGKPNRYEVEEDDLTAVP